MFVLLIVIESRKMFTVSSFQNQLYLPISHIASVLGSIHNATSTAVTVPQLLQRHTNQKATSEEDIICPDSFLQMIQNCTELSLREFKQKDVMKKLSDCIKPCMSVKLNSNWRVSHISADTFFENKHGFSENELWESTFGITRPRQLLSTITHHLFQQDVVNALFYQQRRGFKTRQSRLIDKPRLSINIADKIPVLRLLKDSKKADKAKLQSEAEQSERLKTLLSEENLLPEEQQRLKIAFAEGYLSADVKSKTGGTKMRIFNIFRDLMGIVLIIALLVSFMGGPFRRVLIGNSNEVAPEEIDVSFDDVKGVEEAKQELQEIVEFLRNPEKFSALGGKLPKGVLLVGPPGAGKTLLARAVAGEAGVPFFHAAGPEFDEILVGQGARRVRDLFSTAKARAPCVIFIDEIDSVGAKRTSSVLHPYANQTINQLLSEMDGFRQNEGVIVLGATNRRDDLDKALLRPGRFDVEIQVPIPDLKGRKEIIDLYLGKVKVDLDVDIDMLARGTTGFTGADLENMVNQAALRAAIDACTTVNMKYLENSRDKVLMGPERKSRIPDEEANTITAFHEGGHTIVAHYTKDAQPLHKVTIIPRGPSLGHTAYIPEKEYYHTTKAQMLAMLDTLMGGRAAEELIFGSEKITSGAADDLRRATNLATQMVKNYGMSEKVGVRTFEDNRSTLVVVNDIGQGTAETIDNEIKRILTDSYDRAKHILRTHAKEHKLLAEALLKYETLDAEDIKAIIDGRELRKS